MAGSGRRGEREIKVLEREGARRANIDITMVPVRPTEKDRKSTRLNSSH